MAVSELPGNPNAVWTVKKNYEGLSLPSNMLFCLAVMVWW